MSSICGTRRSFLRRRKGSVASPKAENRRKVNVAMRSEALDGPENRRTRDALTPKQIDDGGVQRPAVPRVLLVIKMRKSCPTQESVIRSLPSA
jgi:hypothetical protein